MFAPKPDLAFRALLLALAVCATAARAGRSAPSHERLPLQTDFDRCALDAADYGDENAQGRVRLELLIRKSGNVYASFVHDEAGIEDRRLERCLTSGALLWMLPAVAIDYSRAYELSFVPGGTEIDFSSRTYWAGRHFSGQGRASVFMPDINDAPRPAALNVKAAQETLEVADWATDAERGIAYLSVHQYPEALKALRAALVGDASDPVALRGLSQALAESGGDLGEARAAAELLVSISPESVGGHEALLRVCLLAGDDNCAYRAFEGASHSKDLAPRSRLIAEQQPAAEAAAARLRVAAQARAKMDPCLARMDDEALARCLVRRCLDPGSVAYAAEVHGKAAGDWLVSRAPGGKLVFTKPLGLPGKDAAAEDPRWLVTLGPRSVRMVPVNAAARHVSLRHTPCTVMDPQLVKGEQRQGTQSREATIEEPVVRAAARGKPHP